MMHTEAMHFWKTEKFRYPELFRSGHVLEIGSLNVNGSLRGLFHSDVEYLGIDLISGTDVDMVCVAHELPDCIGKFDYVISAEALEHDRYWRQTLRRMYELCLPSGRLALSCATTGRGVHGTSTCGPECSPGTVAVGWNHYQNLTAEDIINTICMPGMFNEYSIAVHETACDLYFAGTRGA